MLRIARNLNKTGSIWITEVNTISLDIKTDQYAREVMVQGRAASYLGQAVLDSGLMEADHLCQGPHKYP